MAMNTPKKQWETPAVHRLSVKSFTLTKAAADNIEKPGKHGQAWGKGNPS